MPLESRARILSRPRHQGRDGDAEPTPTAASVSPRAHHAAGAARRGACSTVVMYRLVRSVPSPCNLCSLLMPGLAQLPWGLVGVVWWGSRRIGRCRGRFRVAIHATGNGHARGVDGSGKTQSRHGRGARKRRLACLGTGRDRRSCSWSVDITYVIQFCRIVCYIYACVDDIR